MSYFKPLNTKGFGHVELILAVAFVAVFAFVGVRVLNQSHADTLTPDTTATTTTLTYKNGKIWSGYYTINGDGTGFTGNTLPANAGAQQDNMSYDGTKIAYFTYPGLNVLGTANVNGTNAKIITTLTSSNIYLSPPMWSPNGSLIAVEYQQLSGTRNYGIWLVKSDGTGGHTLKNFDVKDNSAVSWFANSTSLLYMNYSAYTPAGSKICSITISGTYNVCNAVQVGTVKVYSNFTHAAISQDGKKVAMIADNLFGTQAPSADVYTVNKSGTGLKKLTNWGTGQQVQAVIWSPDQTKLAYLLEGGNGAPYGLHVMNADGTGDKLITTLSYPYSLSWAHL